MKETPAVKAMISIREAQAELMFSGDKKGRALARYLRAKEKELKSRLIHGDRTTGYKVSLVEIKLRCPELRHSSVDSAIKEFKAHMKGVAIRTRKQISEYHAETVQPQINELFDRDEQLGEIVGDLQTKYKNIEAKVSSLAQMPKPIPRSKIGNGQRSLRR